MTSIKCPHCDHELNAGAILGQLNRRIGRRHTPENKAKMAARLALARERLAEKRAAQQKLEWLTIPIIPLDEIHRP